MNSKLVPFSGLYQDIQSTINDARPFLPPTQLGRHVLGEFFDCKTLPNDVTTIQEQLEEAARIVGATIVQSVFHSFNPYGLSGVDRKSTRLNSSHSSVSRMPSSA